ncbi:hypothetical protein HDU76_001552 [Blyttiomyces sp. JEL0837]|nr:hypothetical protein HDU76_001552 [Blyttiomyces sp. JEL0837]
MEGRPTSPASEQRNEQRQGIRATRFGRERGVIQKDRPNKTLIIAQDMNSKLLANNSRPAKLIKSLKEYFVAAVSTIRPSKNWNQGKVQHLNSAIQLSQNSQFYLTAELLQQIYESVIEASLHDVTIMRLQRREGRRLEKVLESLRQALVKKYDKDVLKLVDKLADVFATVGRDQRILRRTLLASRNDTPIQSLSDQANLIEQERDEALAEAANGTLVMKQIKSENDHLVQEILVRQQEVGRVCLQAIELEGKVLDIEKKLSLSVHKLRDLETKVEKSATLQRALEDIGGSGSSSSNPKKTCQRLMGSLDKAAKAP